MKTKLFNRLEKAVFAIPHNLAHLFLRKGRQKPNKLNYSHPHNKVCFAHFFAHLTSVQSKAQSHKRMVFLFL
jgi:hypothetical protein